MKNLILSLFVFMLFSNILKAESSLPECEGSPLEVKKFSLTGGTIASTVKLLRKWRNCFGTLIKKDGSEYIGEFQGGKFSGQGTLIRSDGAAYKGSF